MEDLEDLFDEKKAFTYNNYSSESGVIPRVRRRLTSASKKTTSQYDCDGDQMTRFQENHSESDMLQSFIPGQQTIYIHTWGCAHNSSDSEYMAGQLAVYGFQVTEQKDDADLWLLNSCTVKNPAEDHLRNEIRNAQQLGKKVVVAGCVSQGAPKSEYLNGISILGVQQIGRVVEVVEETLKGNTVRLLGSKRAGGRKIGGASLSLPKIRRNPLVEIISISTGCLNQCTYCKTKHARGDLGSYTIEEIVERASSSFSEGVREVWLTSEDTGAYGRDIGYTLPELLRKLVEVIPEGARLRLGMTNPPYILDHLEEMAEILQHPRVYSFLHVPVQSGSDDVLSHMRREYTVSDFREVVDTLRERVPGITIATDIICGYPTETEEDFMKTMKLCEEYRFPSLFINQFYPRPGTVAAKLKRLSTKEVKRRTRLLSEFFQSYETYSAKLGEIQTVLITEEAFDGLHWVGHNKFYEQVLVSKEEADLGDLLDVIIYETGKHFLRGRSLLVHPLCEDFIEPLVKGQVSGVLLDDGCQRVSGRRDLTFIDCLLLPLSNPEGKKTALAFMCILLSLILRTLLFIFDR